MAFRLAITPGKERTVAEEACIRAEQHRDAIFEAIIKLRNKEHEYFGFVFKKPSTEDEYYRWHELPGDDQEYLVTLGVKPNEYAGWETAHAAWKAATVLPMLEPIPAKAYDRTRLHLRSGGAEIPEHLV